jgi:uncharacterized protein YuzE
VGESQLAEYDEEADVLYVTLLDAEVDDTVNLGDLRMVDYTSDGRVVGVEFISPSSGVDLHDVPDADVIEGIISRSGYPFRVVA